LKFQNAWKITKQKGGKYSITFRIETLEKAVDAIRSGLLFLKKAENFNIPRFTLQEHLQDHASGKYDYDAKIGRKTALPESVGEKMAGTVKQTGDEGYQETDATEDREIV
jgi:hypothetical protein